MGSFRDHMMARYFFHVSDADGLIEDQSGLELSSLSEAKSEALHVARNFAAARILAGKKVDGRKVLVFDAKGELVHEVAVRGVIGELGN